VWLHRYKAKGKSKADTHLIHKSTTIKDLTIPCGHTNKKPKSVYFNFCRNWEYSWNWIKKKREEKWIKVKPFLCGFSSFGTRFFRGQSLFFLAHAFVYAEATKAKAHLGSFSLPLFVCVLFWSGLHFLFQYLFNLKFFCTLCHH